MDIKRGQIVFVTAGKEKGRYMVVLESDQTTVMLTDGRKRPCDHPKRKNIKHVTATNKVASEEEIAANSRVKSLLRNFTA